ncbi:sensor histidine kinase YxjM [Dictyobacter alpinus]|uniref:Sensor histidine kinase YxjM n=1 Tax=Dictyobacter alpinus TaxID=2014873 RepID=A0A402BFP6_9CHLR|nr:sensor histidine kinase [Dictyobacter alpinus]GCE30241.1 sensor histidine kinase YxjM [Dictyobacter alpinus]
MQSEIEKNEVSFQRTFKRTRIGFATFSFIYLLVLNIAVLASTPTYMHDWHGVTCIVFSIIAFLLYAFPTIMDPQDWPPSLPYALSVWGSMYLMVALLSLINTNYLWAFYLVFSLSFALFSSRRLLLMVSVVAFTMFSFQGLWVWPLSSVFLFSIVSQSMTIFGLTGLNMLFQGLLAERYERTRLFRELSEANVQLEEAHRRLEQSVEQEQELAVLRERTRLAREMHDTLGHALVLIAVKLEAAQRLRQRDPERCDQELESTKGIARESMAGLRASIADLRSPALEHERIQQALERSVRELTQRCGLRFTYTLQTDMTRLPEVLEETLWKICQEAFANIEKHAQATHINLSISQCENQLLLTIQDDGIGLPEAYYHYLDDGTLSWQSPDGHYGLRGMLERVEDAGGHLSLSSAPHKGTTVEVRLPLMGFVVV